MYYAIFETARSSFFFARFSLLWYSATVLMWRSLSSFKVRFSFFRLASNPYIVYLYWVSWSFRESFSFLKIRLRVSSLPKLNELSSDWLLYKFDEKSPFYTVFFLGNWVLILDFAYFSYFNAFIISNFSVTILCNPSFYSRYFSKSFL